MEKRQSQFFPIAAAFKEKLLEAIKSEHKGEAIKKTVDEYIAEIQKNVKKFQ